jgi:hypothetical protein
MHDGGTDMQLFVENGRMSKSGQMVCKSVMHYGGRAGYGGTAGHSRRDGHGGHGGGEHISDPGACTDFGTVSKGQYLRGVANYNADTHQLMEINGKKEALMGNMRVYVGPI